jgi:hypothetical protein
MTPRPPEPERFFHYRAFALPFSSSFRLPGVVHAPTASHPLILSLASSVEIERLWSGAAGEPVWTTAIDERLYTMELGNAGDYLMTYRDTGTFLLSPDMRELRCAPAARWAPDWQRFLLDTVLWSASLLRGVELLHASAVHGTKGVVAFAGFSGAGKTSVAAELIRRGGGFFTDDILALAPSLQGLRAHPGPSLMNVPRKGRSGVGFSGFCERLARFTNEDWVGLTDAAPEPDRVAAICLLRRRRGAGLSLRPLQPTVLDLLPFTIGFRHLRGRMRQQFMLFARLATEVPVYELFAPLDAPPPALADLVEPLVLGPAGHERAA